ncbi:MAG: 1-acyl-sn-glycerol-3-phosphate acyltransferase [Bacteroidetes bacterium]|nr:1-acyl-sn-glycerol-3-phosphate acyltransferase [Bacteroidota bacterium]
MQNSYRRILAENDTYKTDKSVRTLNLFGPTLSFYPRLTKIIYGGSKTARKGEYNEYAWANSALDIFEAIETSGVVVNIEGMQHLRNLEGPAVIIGNHMSSMETMLPVTMIQPVKPFCYVVKKELATYPIFSDVVMAREPIVVGRTNPREDLKIMMEEGAERLGKGKSILIFPQKTRSVQFIASEFNSLGVKLAKKNNVPVIPFAVLTDAWSNGKRLKDFGKIDPSKPTHFAFGAPINVESKGQEEHEQVIDFIAGKLTEWGRPELVI